MKLFSLASSSKGNCTYISSNGQAILIDAGISFKGMLTMLSLCQIREETIKAIFLTHEHQDHISGLKVISKRLQVPIYGSYATLDMVLKKNAIGADNELYEIDKKPAVVGDLSINAFHTTHDCADSLGYCVTDGNKKASVCTDLGCFPEEGFEELENSDLILLESNYDKNILINGKYPAYLKKRIMSKYGHLSNDDCSKFIELLINKNVSRFLLGHLSENNNMPDLALYTSVNYLQEKKMKFGDDYTIDVAPVKSHGKCYEI